MSMSNYFKDRFLFILVNAMLFLVLTVILLLFETNSSLILLIFILWFLPLTSYMFMEYFKYKRFYDEFRDLIDTLDQKYLLPEVMKEPDFIEGKLLHEGLSEINKDMHEHVKHYRELESDYREYIETWVHEIKTPMASIGLILDNNESKAGRSISHEMKKIENYVEEVLYYARSSHVGKDYLIKEIDLEELVKKVIRRNAADFIRKGISIDMDEVTGKIFSDSKWLEYILNQIIGNAVKYTKTGEGSIRVYTTRNTENMVLTVEDHGIGILPKDLGRVFEKGFTGENGRVFGKSTGMGLYLSKKLTEQLGHGLSVFSEPGSGTKVQIIFPLGSINLME